MGIKEFFGIKTKTKSESLEILGKKIADLEEQNRILRIRGLQPGAPSKFAGTRKIGLIPFSLIKQTYQECSAVRACVETLRQIISTQEWEVIGRGESVDQEHVDIVTDLLENPNANNESFQQMISKILLDILLYDAGVIEKVRNEEGQVIELFSRDGSTFTPEGDQHGMVEKYTQRVSGKRTVIFDPKDIVYVMLSPQNDSYFGMPIMESIVNESAALLDSSAFISDTFSKDEIPPGIVAFEHADQDEVDRLKEQFKMDAGKYHHMIKLVANVGKMDWLQFKRPARDMQLTELSTRLDKIIYRNFYLSPTTMGVTEGVPRATAEVQEEITYRKMIRPVSKLISYFINTQIIWSDFFRDVKFRFIIEQPRHSLEFAKSASVFVQSGIKTINEVRDSELGMEPIPGGDDPFLIIGNQMIPIAQKKLPEEVSKKKAPKGAVRKLEVRPIPLEGVKTFDVKALEKLKIEYYDEIEKFWQIMKERVVRDMKKSFVQKAVGPNQAVINQTRELIEANLQKFSNKWRDLSKKYYSSSMEIGISGGVKLVGKPSVLTKAEFDTLLNDLVVKNEAFVKSNLIKDVRSNLRAAQLYEYENWEDTTSAVVHALESEEFRLGRYATSLWGSAHEAMHEELKRQGYKNVSWIVTSGNPCEDCEAIAVGNPYNTVEEIGTVPGAGETRCSGNCQCLLSYEV